MHVTINGERAELADGMTLSDLVAARTVSSKGVAAAVDGAVAPRGTWTNVALRDGQSVELITAVQGG